MENERKTFNEIVGILRIDRKAKNSDAYLYLAYIQLNGYSHLDFLDIFLSPRKYKLLSYASVSRLRRKAQEKDRETKRYEIQSDKTIKQIRKELEKRFREEYRKGFNFAESEDEEEWD